jgi:AcrR family transcriptional regulator
VAYDVGMSESPVGLRSIKKQLTRESIAASALQLSLDKGLSNVTIDEIAHLAFVSPRTVSNYFSCKEEAIVAAGSTLAELVGRYGQARGGGGSAMTALRDVVTDFFGGRTTDELEQTRQWQRLIEGNVSLRAYQLADYDEAEDHLQSIVADRGGTGDSLYPRLVAAAGIVAIKVAVGIWARSDEPRGLDGLLGRAFDHIRNGLDRPPPALPLPADS